ncbi:MAG: transmembrane transport protein [Planctomycetota bacterium]
MNDLTNDPSPTLSSTDVLNGLGNTLSLRRRLVYTAILCVTTLAATGLTLLWATEPDRLPARTQAAFAMLIAINLGWSGLSVWVLTRREPLFASDRVTAGSMGLAFAMVFTAVATPIGFTTRGVAAGLAAGLAGLVLCLMGGGVLISAVRRRSALLRELGRTQG